MTLTDHQRYRLGHLVQDILDNVAAIAANFHGDIAKEPVGNQPPPFHFLLEDPARTDLTVAQYLYRITKATENLPVVMFEPTFNPLAMCRYLMFIEGATATDWSRLAKDAADIVGYELPVFNKEMLRLP